MVSAMLDIGTKPFLDGDHLAVEWRYRHQIAVASLTERFLRHGQDCLECGAREGVSARHRRLIATSPEQDRYNVAAVEGQLGGRIGVQHPPRAVDEIEPELHLSRCESKRLHHLPRRIGIK